MIGIDTNSILRVFIDDDEAQVAAVAKLLAGRGPASIRLTNVVIAEFFWTLMRRYKREKADIIDVLEQLLQREELVFENRNAVMTALRWYESGPADFADYLVGALTKKPALRPPSLSIRTQPIMLLFHSSLPEAPCP